MNDNYYIRVRVCDEVIHLAQRDTYEAAYITCKRYQHSYEDVVYIVNKHTGAIIVPMGLHMYIFVIYHSGKRVCMSQVYMSERAAYDAFPNYIDAYHATEGYSVCLFELAPIELATLESRLAVS